MKAHFRFPTLLVMMMAICASGGRDPLAKVDVPVPKQPAGSREPTFVDDIGGPPKSFSDLLSRYGVSLKIKSPAFVRQSGGPSPSYYSGNVDVDVPNGKVSVNAQFGGGLRGSGGPSMSLEGTFSEDTYEASVGGSIGVGGTNVESKITAGTNQATELEGGVSKYCLKFLQRWKSGRSSSHALIDTDYFTFDVNLGTAIKRYATVYGAMGRAAKRNGGTLLQIDTKRKIVKAVKDAVVRGVMIRFDLEGIDEELPAEQLEELDAELARVLSGETEGFVFQFGDRPQESFTTLSLREWLAGDQESLGQLTRVRGCVITEDDILIIGQVEPEMPAVEGDFLIVALNAVYREGGVPFISLDPNPLDFAGAQRSRIGGVSEQFRNTEFVRVMLEADYDMKKIMLGEMDSGVPELETTYDLVARYPEQVETDPHRFWLTPMVNLVGDVRIHGSTILFDSRAEVLTEREKTVGDRMIPTGDASVLDKRAAFSMTQHYEELERQHVSFYKLHQVFDVCKLAAVLRYRDVRSALLDAAADRPARRVEVPESYPGIGPKMVEGTEIFVMGGAKSRVRLNKHRFREAPELEGLSQGQGVLAANQVSYLGPGAVPELLVHEAIEDFANADLEVCVEKISRALEADPDLPDGYAYRGLALYELGQLQRALADLDHAVEQEPSMKAMRAVVRLAVGDEDGARRDLSDVLGLFADEPDIWKMSAIVKLGLLDLEGARAAAAKAVEMCPLDAEALSIYAMIEDYAKMDADKARERIAQQRLLPMPLGLAFQRGFAAMLAQQNDEAIFQLDRALKLATTRYADHPAVKSLYVCERIWTALSVLHTINGANGTYKPLEKILEIAFSPDGRGLAFVGMNSASEHVLVIDGKDEVLPGKYLGWERSGGEAPAVSIDGGDENREELRWIGFEPEAFPRLLFDPSGNRLACLLDSDVGPFIMVGDLVYGPFDAILAQPRFSDDGKRLEIAIAQGRDLVWKTLLLESDADNAEPPAPRPIGTVPDGLEPRRVVLADDGKHVLITGYRPDSDVEDAPPYYLDGTPRPDILVEKTIRINSDDLHHVEFPLPRFAPDSARLVYVSTSDEKVSVVFGSTAGQPYDTINDRAGFAISDDGEHLAYVGGRLAENAQDRYDNPFQWYLNVDGAESPISSPSGPVIMSPDGRHVAFVADGDTQLIVDGQVKAVDAEIDSLKYSPNGELAFIADEVSMIENSMPIFMGTYTRYRTWQTESNASRALRRKRRQLEAVVHTVHAGLTSGLPGVVNQWVQQLTVEAKEKLPTPRVRLYLGGRPSMRHQDIKNPMFSRDGSHLAYAAKVGKNWHVFLDGRPILLHPGFRYAEKMRQQYPDWNTPNLLLGLSAMLQGFDSPLEAPTYFDLAFAKSRQIDPLFEDLQRRFGSDQLREILLVTGAAMGWAGSGYPRPYLKRLEAADGLAGEFARAFVGMIHPRLPNQRIARDLAERMRLRQIERPVDAVTYGFLVAIVAEMELQEQSDFQMAGDPNKALVLVRSIHTKLPPKPRSQMESRLISQFRISGIDLTIRAYQALAVRDQELQEVLEGILRRAHADTTGGEIDLDEALRRTHEFVERAVQDSRENDVPMVSALVEAKFEGLETELISGLLEQLRDQETDWDEVIARAGQQLHELDMSQRPERFEKVYSLLCDAVGRAATASDLLTLDALVSDPMNFKRSIPADPSSQTTAEAVVKLQGIRARLQMKQLSNTIYAAQSQN